MTVFNNIKGNMFKGESREEVLKNIRTDCITKENGKIIRYTAKVYFLAAITK